jgi:hypothetical protein
LTARRAWQIVGVVYGSLMAAMVVLVVAAAAAKTFWSNGTQRGGY